MVAGTSGGFDFMLIVPSKVVCCLLLLSLQKPFNYNWTPNGSKVRHFNFVQQSRSSSTNIILTLDLSFIKCLARKSPNFHFLTVCKNPDLFLISTSILIMLGTGAEKVPGLCTLSREVWLVALFQWLGRAPATAELFNA